MSTFFDLVRFEFKKIFCRKRTVIVLTLVIIISALSVFGTVIGRSVYAIDENGNETEISRYADEMIDRQYGEALSGRVIDADLIMEAVEAYKKIPINGNNYTNNPYYQNIARKYSEIYGIVSRTLGLKNVYEFRELTREQAEQFDEVRRNRISNSAVSENMQNYRQKCIERSPTTLTYEYWGGYYRFFTIMYTTAIMAGAAIAVMLSGIFSDEYTSGADNIILSSKHGKGLVVGAKLFTAFSVSAALITLLSAITLIETMSVWGTNGADGMLALADDVFPYPITIGQATLLYFICMLMGSIMFAAITVLLSAKLKLSFNTIVIMIVVLIAPLFISIPNGKDIWA